MGHWIEISLMERHADPLRTEVEVTITQSLQIDTAAKMPIVEIGYAIAEIGQFLLAHCVDSVHRVDQPAAAPKADCIHAVAKRRRPVGGT